MANIFGNNCNNFSGSENVESVDEAIENAALEIVDEEIMRKDGEAHQQHQLRLNRKAALLNAFSSAIAAPSVAITQHQPHRNPQRQVHYINANNRSNNDGRRATKCERARPPAKQYSRNESTRPPKKINRFNSNSNNCNCGVDTKQLKDCGEANNNNNNNKCNHAQVQTPVHPPVFILSGQTFNQFTHPIEFMPPHFAPGYPIQPPGGCVIPPAATMMPIEYSHPLMPPPTVAAPAQAPAQVHHDEKPINVVWKNPAPTQDPVPSRANHAKQQPLNNSGRNCTVSKRRPPTSSKKNPPQARTRTQARSNPLDDPHDAGQGPTQSKPRETSNDQGGETNQRQLNNQGVITTAKFHCVPETENSISHKNYAMESQSLNRNCNRYSEMQQKQKEDHSCNPLIQAPRFSKQENASRQSSRSQKQTSETVYINQNHGGFLASAPIQDSAMAFASAMQNDVKSDQQLIGMDCGQNVGNDQVQDSHTGKKGVPVPALPPLKPLDSKPNSAKHALGSRTTDDRLPSESGNATGGNIKSKKPKEKAFDHHRINSDIEPFMPRNPTFAEGQKERGKGEYIYHSSHHSHKFLIRDFSSPHWNASESLPEGYVQFLAESTTQERQTLRQTSWDCSVRSHGQGRENQHEPQKDSGKRVSLLSHNNRNTEAINVFPKQQDDEGYETGGVHGARDVFNGVDPDNFSEEESMVGSQNHVEL